MKPYEALALLGSTRVIWIDDQFGIETADELAKLLGDNLEISRQLELADFESIFNRIDFEDQDARTDLLEKLKELDEKRLTEIARGFHAKFVEESQGTADLDDNQISHVREQLKIQTDDTWPFDHAERLIRDQALCENGDSHITYIVDLQDQYGATDNERGLDLIRLLGQSNSKATAFLLTRNATLTSEASLEDSLRAKLADGAGTGIESPICVIAKERLEGDKVVIAEGLRVAIKRAGLRRGIHEVLLRANSEVMDAFSLARKRLLSIPPEQLDHYVVERAYKEGVSELHVVERALSASMSERFKTLFATDQQAIKGASRFRALRAIKLDPPSSPSVDLQAFRRMELWEDEQLVNASYSSLACGDVFEAAIVDGNEVARSERFILLVQPCDVMLRYNGSRDFDTGVLVQIAPRNPGDENAGSLKKPILPFVLDGQELVCEFRKAATVRLAILDSATWRDDGMVKYEHDAISSFSSMLLPGQKKNAERVAKLFEEALTQRAKLNQEEKEWFMPICHLTLASSKVFDLFTTPKFSPKTIPGKKKNEAIQTGSFSWNLRRVGRVRMPYAAALLSNYLAVQGREAFELDYLKIEKQSCAADCGADTVAASDDTDDQTVQLPASANAPLYDEGGRSGVMGWVVRLFGQTKSKSRKQERALALKK